MDTNTVAAVEPLAGELVVPSTPERARQRVATIRTALEVAVEELIAAWREEDNLALGYGPGPAGWAAYVVGEYGDLRLTLPADLRQDRLVAMRGAGMPVSAIKATPGAGSQGLVAKDLKALRAAGRLVDEAVRSFDGAARAATATPKPTPKAEAVELTTAQQVARVADRKGAGGITTLDVMASLRWRQGPASAAVARAAKAGLIVHAGGYRDGFTVYARPTPALPAGPAS